EIADHSEPEKIQWPRMRFAQVAQPGTLVLRVEGPTALEIQHLSGVILERVNRFFGWEALGAVRLRQAPLRRKLRPPPPVPDPESTSLIAAGGGGYYAWNTQAAGQSNPSVPQPPGGADVPMAELMAPGPLGDNALGSSDAPVTIVEYASMTCPHCAHFHETTFPEMKKKYIDTGKVRFIFREFPLDALAAAGSMLARCSGKDKYFPMIETLFSQQREWVVQKPLEPMLGIA